jgi:NAD(P) transhydrogenase subunit alpha
VLNGVTLFAPLNLPATVPGHASQLYSRNIANFLALIVKDGALRLNMEDEILSGSCVAHQGKIANPRVASALEAAAGSQKVSQ